MGRPRYSATEHLALSLLRGYAGRIAMLTVYLDASGSRHESEIVTLAGFLSEVEQWMKFEEEWQYFLDRFGIPYLHMREFAFFKGPYAFLRGDEQKRREILNTLCGVIERRTLIGFCRNVRVRDFNAID